MSKPYLEDIICAEASPGGVAAISLLRVSGKGSADLAARILDLSKTTLTGHKAYYKKIENDGKLLDEVLLTYFKTRIFLRSSRLIKQILKTRSPRPI